MRLKARDLDQAVIGAKLNRVSGQERARSTQTLSQRRVVSGWIQALIFGELGRIGPNSVLNQCKRSAAMAHQLNSLTRL